MYCSEQSALCIPPCACWPADSARKACHIPLSHSSLLNECPHADLCTWQHLFLPWRLCLVAGPNTLASETMMLLLLQCRQPPPLPEAVSSVMSANCASPCSDSLLCLIMLRIQTSSLNKPLDTSSLSKSQMQAFAVSLNCCACVLSGGRSAAHPSTLTCWVTG